MKPFTLLIMFLLLLGCSDPSTKVVSSETVKVTTPDEVEIRDGEISQVLANEESKDRFVAYLESQNIYYRLDDRFPNEVIWATENDEHREKVTRAAFGIPENQVQKLFHNSEEYNKYIAVLQDLEIEHVAQPFKGQFVVIWTPKNDNELNSVNAKYQQ